jgi:P-type Ca2+ transporter type 2C
MWAVLVSLALQVGILSTPVMQRIFKVAPLPVEDWELMMAMALLPLAIVEATKWLQKREGSGQPSTGY